MAEEQVEPPNEKIGWKEIPAIRERFDYNSNIPFYELRAYDNVLLTMVLGTFSFFGGEVILKALFVADDPNKATEHTYFLKLENGTWVRGVLNGKCDMHLRTREESGAVILSVMITIQTENGFQTRTFIKGV